MSKFSLFDFISFLLPGGTLLVFLFWYFSFGWRSLGLSIPFSITSQSLLPFIVVAYIFGHVLNELGNVCAKLPYFRNAILEPLKANSELESELNDACCSCFNQGFKNNQTSDLMMVRKYLYDRMYYTLEMEGKDSKIKTLRSQVGFFQNMIPLWGLATLLCVIALVTKKVSFPLFVGVNYVQIGMLMGFSLLMVFFSCRYFYQRRRTVANTLYRTFLVWAQLQPNNANAPTPIVTE